MEMSQKESNEILKYCDRIIQTIPIGESFSITTHCIFANDYFKKTTKDEFNITNTLKQLGFISYYKKDDNYWITEKGIEAKRLGGYFNYEKRKDVIQTKDRIIFIFSIIAIIISLLPFVFETPKITELELKIEKLNMKMDSLVSSQASLLNDH